MRVLQLHANHKWTGPAELVVNLCDGLVQAGVDLLFLPGKREDGVSWVGDHAESRGIPTNRDFTLDKHFNVIQNIKDVSSLGRFLKSESFDLVHTHLTNGHFVAGAAIWRAGVSLPLIRTCYDGTGPKNSFRNRFLYRRFADRVFCFSDAIEASLTETFRVEPDRIHRVEPPLDLERFDPKRSVPNGRGRLGIPEDAFVVGIVARLQKHRRYGLFFEAIRRAREVVPSLQAVVLGRGTHKESVGFEPVRELGLDEVVHFPGYLQDDDYVGMVKAFDTKVYLVPGSDGTCRAVREAMAMGTPIIATRRGMLPELVRDDKSGILIEETTEALTEAILALATSKEKTEELGKGAMDQARPAYSIKEVTKKTLQLYEQILNSRTQS